MKAAGFRHPKVFNFEAWRNMGYKRARCVVKQWGTSESDRYIKFPDAVLWNWGVIPVEGEAGYGSENAKKWIAPDIIFPTPPNDPPTRSSRTPYPLNTPAQ
jgi:hypothetical protein